MLRFSALTLALLLAVPTAALAEADPATPPGATTTTTPTSAADQRAAGVPALRVTRKVRGLHIPWDVQPLPRGRLLISERETRRLILWRDGRKRVLRFPARIWGRSEGGLMALEVDPAFGRNRLVYTCHGGFQGEVRDVRVVAWRMNKRYRGVRHVRTLVSGMPVSSGRHSGCRLLIDRAGHLLVGTGDAAIGTNPQDLDSLGGKVLAVNRFSGAALPSNPFAGSTGKRRFVLTYGHRNVQGLAQRKDGTIWSVEHGSDRDDEVNRLVPGGNYGWNPVPGYNESVPMTDHSLPGTQIDARWRSGYPTIATSGAAWVRGKKWGAYNGALAVAALKGSHLLFLKFDSAGRLLWQRAPVAVRKFGRLRSVTVAPNKDLLVTTSNGTGDVVLRVRPR